MGSGWSAGGWYLQAAVILVHCTNPANNCVVVL